MKSNNIVEIKTQIITLFDGALKKWQKDANDFSGSDGSGVEIIYAYHTQHERKKKCCVPMLLQFRTKCSLNLEGPVLYECLSRINPHIWYKSG